jgi:hypothetical protein
MLGGSLVKDVLSKHVTCLLTIRSTLARALVPVFTYPVESDNMPAIRVLEKLGFRLYSAFLYTEVEKYVI